VAKKRVRLKDKPGAAILHGKAGGILPIEENTARCRVFKAPENAQKRGLARAGRTEEGHESAGGDCEGNGVQGGGDAKLLGDFVDFDVHGRSP
jgi:hypothetical protein